MDLRVSSSFKRIRLGLSFRFVGVISLVGDLEVARSRRDLAEWSLSRLLGVLSDCDNLKGFSRSRLRLFPMGGFSCGSLGSVGSDFSRPGAADRKNPSFVIPNRVIRDMYVVSGYSLFNLDLKFPFSLG